MGTKLNKKGFSVLEILIVLIVILVLGLGGWYVYKQNHKTKTSTTTASITTKSGVSNTDPYSGWNMGTLKYEKMSFKYPKNWLISGTSAAVSNQPNDGDYLNSPGNDDYSLTSPSGAILQLTENLRVTHFHNLGYDNVTFLGKPAYMDFGLESTGEYDQTVVSEACLQSENATSISFFKSKYITATEINADPVSPATSSELFFCFSTPSSRNGGDSISNLKADNDYKTAKLIIESIQYN